MAETWEKAAQNLSLHKPSLFLKQKNILVLPGLVSVVITTVGNIFMKLFTAV